MRGVVNDALRSAIGLGAAVLAAALDVRHGLRLRTSARRQRRLRRAYGLTPATPIERWSASVEESLRARATSAGRATSYAATSGSTAAPKRVPYSRRRLLATRLAFVDMYLRGCRAHGIGRKSVYVMSSLGADDSLTSLLLDERRIPPWLSVLQAPYRVHRGVAMQELARTYGDTAVRLWVIALANPGVLYATNPSTLSVFFDDLQSDWLRHIRLTQDYAADPPAFHPHVRLVARRLESRGSASRLRRIADSPLPLGVADWAPSLKAYICWTGGYVGPFLKRLARHLPEDRYARLPMYSMSTEVIETVPHFAGTSAAFLPIAGRTCYEFLAEHAEETPGNLVGVDQLEVGKRYSMVVSDAYGLRRYQTGDVFLCRGHVRGVPDLAFDRRLDLAYSFTGEKLTGQQAAVVLERLRLAYPRIGDDTFMSLVPSAPPGEPVPHYKLLIGIEGALPPQLQDDISRACDRLTGDVNSEYRSKRESGRLGPIRLVEMPAKDFAARFGADRLRSTWESQFKFLPLFPVTWEPAGNADADPPTR